MSAERRFRVLYPDGEITRLLTRQEALPLFELWGTELLEVKGESAARKNEHLLHTGPYAVDAKYTQCTCLEAVQARMRSHVAIRNA